MTISKKIISIVSAAAGAKGISHPQLHSFLFAFCMLVAPALMPSVAIAALPGQETADANAQQKVTHPGTVLKVQGTVSVTRANAVVLIGSGDPVWEGDVFSNPSGASVLLQFADDAKLLVRPNTKVSLSRIVNSGALETLGHSIDLAVGAIRYVTGAVGKSRPQGVRFKTPNATIGIRGTDIDIVHAPKTRSLQNSGTYVQVNSGEIELDGIDGSKVTLTMSEQAFAGVPGPKTRSGTRAPAARKLDAPAKVFSTGELDLLIEAK